MTVLREQNSMLRRLMQTGSAGLLGCALALGSCWHAMAGDVTEEEPADIKFIKQLFNLKDGEAIDYRERSPLVVPPTRELPAPESLKVTGDPAWPKDQERKVAKKKYDARSSRGFDEDARPLTPAQLDVGRKVGAGRDVGSVDDAGRPLSPAQLGYKGGLFGSLFKGDKKDETAVFQGEPPRVSLTDPPTGYLTPSASQPYGLTERKEAPKPFKLEDRGTSMD